MDTGIGTKPLLKERLIRYVETVGVVFVALASIVTANIVRLFCRISLRNTLKSIILWKPISLDLKTEMFYHINFLAFLEDTVSQLWLAWVIQGM